KLITAVREEISSGTKTEFLGPNPVGYINYGADGRMLVLTVATGRRKPAGPKATSAEVEALFRSMTSYGGTYTIDGNEVTHHVDVSWNQSWTGTDQKRVARWEGNAVCVWPPLPLGPTPGGRGVRPMPGEKLDWARPAAGPPRSRHAAHAGLKAIASSAASAMLMRAPARQSDI